MYVQQTNACNLPNSSTPMSVARINAQSRRGNRVGRVFVNGNLAMSGLVDGLTPPVPTGQCSDFGSSTVFNLISGFPVPVPPGAMVTPGAPDSGSAAAAAAPAGTVVSSPAVVGASPAAPAAGAVPAGAAAVRSRGRGVRSNYRGKGYGQRYPYGGIVGELAASIPGFSCGSAAPAVSGGGAGGSGTAPAVSSSVIWGVLLGLGALFAFQK